ncbi:acyl-CoA dehydrogenase family protein [Polaromonas sp. C04]|uniref:acyl-CoA dehydrogenase family protein n=1 Tax=Polaromonas sp. C04 TaxID=1945857 RepID=UPI0009860056|nr:acyl-CoA dehydrogenase family protein [Polaromonas sp. C04]OOG53115.1 acyl-CoA dehydrogenase [Polaromonas sp. C04]
MNSYQPSAAAASFMLFDVLRAQDTLAQLPVLVESADTDLMRQVLEEAGKFVGEVVAPLNRDGDEIGARFNDGAVTMPPGFRAAYQAFWQAGWPGLSGALQDGGQGLPVVLEMVLYEWLSAANHGWTMAPGLLHGAYECIKHHASDELKACYLEKVATGEWLTTMCLTEPHAGSDLGLVSTRALPQPDGSFQISGTKIFISGGEHDLSDNIVHLVLARLPDSPPGPKGLSLFLVPKFYQDGSRSAVFCERIEEKMGLHGSPTCVMRFDQATAWLVGEHGKGLNAMFLMMNAARLHVALQGVGLLDAAWQKANAYAQERRQMRAPGPRDTSQAADLITRHPAVQRLLDTQRAWVDAGRVLAYQTAIELDVAKHHPDSARRQQAGQWCALVTPVLKASWTDQAFHGSSDCLQVFGGHGYVREWGIEQIVRDSRVAMIYEGTNEIQAQDLLFRKVLTDQGRGLATILNGLQADLHGCNSASAQRTQEGFSLLRDLLAAIESCDAAAPEKLYSVASDFLRATAIALMAWAWTRLEAAGAPGNGGQAFIRWVWPELAMRRGMVLEALKV